MRWTPALLVVLAAFLSLGPTECNQYTEVTVPASDSEAPWAVGSAYRIYPASPSQPGSEFAGHRWETTAGTVYQYSAPEMQALAAVASSIDDSGARRVRMTYAVKHDCCHLSGSTWSACESTTSAEATVEDQVPGAAAGAHVSNGIYVSQLVQPQTCPAGKRTKRLNFEFRVKAWDYHGNQSSSGPHRIIYDASVD
jgi:hypothetical protein